MDKLISLKDAVALIKDGDVLAIGGNVLHRAPMAACMEIAAQRKKNLKLIKTAGAMDVDLLCLAGCAESVDAGFVSYESEYSLAQHYRKAVQSGTVKGNEHACYTVISALRAGAAGIPFMPVKGLMYGDLLKVNDYFATVDDPFGTGKINVVKAIVPDVCIVHVQKADKQGNALILGPKFDDVLMSRASKKVIVTAETIVPSSFFENERYGADIPHFMVSAVVHLPGGASPCSCEGFYDIDRASLDSFKKIEKREELDAYLKSHGKDGSGRFAGRGRWEW